MSFLIPNNARYEIKFVSFHANIYKLKSWFELHHGGFNHSFENRWINNIYFDSNGHHAFQSNIHGISSRAKIRYRWYGDQLKSENGSLEIKKKRNFFGWKQSFKIYQGPNLRRDTWANVRNSLLYQIPKTGEAWLRSHPSPIIINRYLREYLISHDKKIRVTIDSLESLWDQRCGFKPNISSNHKTPEMIIIEFKFHKSDYAKASSYMQGIPIRVSRHSKYVNGVNTVVGNGVWY